MKRTIALFLAMLFVLALVPMGALADGTNPTVNFTVAYQEKKSDGTLVSLGSGAGFSREYSSAPGGALVGAGTEQLTLPNGSKAIIKTGSVKVAIAAVSGFNGGSLAVTDTGKLTLTGTMVDPAAPPATVALTVTIEYRDPTIAWAGTDITSVTYPGKSTPVATGDSIPAGSVVTVTAADRSAEKLYLDHLSVAGGSVANAAFNASRVATFTMPSADVTALTPVYYVDLILKTSSGTQLDAKRVGMTASGTLSAVEPTMEMFVLDSSGNPVITANAMTRLDTPAPAFDKATRTVSYKLKDSGVTTDLPITLTIESRPLYKVVMEDAELVSVAAGNGGATGLHKTIGSDLYVEAGATVTLRSKTEAKSYKWIWDSAVVTPIDNGKNREISFFMPAATTNFSATAVTQYQITQYDANGSNPAVSYHIPEADVTLTATEPTNAKGFKFVRWHIEEAAGVATEIAASDLTKNPITFKMPEKNLIVTPIYLTTLKLTNANPTFSGAYASQATKYKTETVDGNNVGYWYVPSGTGVTIAPVAPTGTGVEGTFTFSSWYSNSTRIRNQSTTANLTFTMPAEDLEAAVNWKSYTLTVRRYVNSNTVETYTRRPGEYITLDAEAPTGGTAFSFWSHTSGLLITSNNVVLSGDTEPTTRRITVQMPASDAWVTANYAASTDLPYTYTGAHIEMSSEPQRYYALKEYLSTASMKVYYYKDQENTNGLLVDHSQLQIRIFDPKDPNKKVTADDGSFVVAGEFALEITFVVNGVKMADSIIVLNTPNTYIHVSDKRPEYVACYSPYNILNKALYYSGESTTSIDKDGLTVQLNSADHTTGRYFTFRVLEPREYKLTAFNPLVAKYTAANKDYGLYEIPTFADIQTAIASGVAGYKVTNGKYYMQLGIECYDDAQIDSTGKVTQMRYLPSAVDAIWIEVQDNSALKINLKNFSPSDEVDPQSGSAATWPIYSWNINYSEFAAATRTFDVELTGGTEAKSIAVTNEDPSVAYVTVPDASKPLAYRLVPRSIGVTKFTFYVRGTGDITINTDGSVDSTNSGATTNHVVTLEVTVRDDVGGVVNLTKVTSLNKEVATLYVGNKLTLYPSVYSPNNADTTMEWSAQFSDANLPRNVEYYVKVDPITGVVESLKYTEREIVIVGRAVNFDSTSTSIATKGTNGEYTLADVRGNAKKDNVASCTMTIAQIPVYSMTLYPTELAMFRHATAKLTTKVYPEAATDQKINWSSSNSNIASVDNEGNVTAHLLGTAIITATANGSETAGAIYKTCAVTIKESVLLTEILLNRNSATLGIGDSTALTVYYAPAAATTQSVTWESSDPSVATVTAAGKVYGIAEGTAVITATASDGSGKKAACVISVSNIVASAVVLNKQTLALNEDDTAALTATVYPTNVSAKGVAWTSQNAKVATVDADGVVTGTGGGSTVITATAKDASTRYADCVVVVTAKIPVTGLALNLSSFDLLLNDTTVLKATPVPANATEKLTWTSSNPAVATVDENGKVSGVATGSAVITAKAGMKSVSITVSVVTKLYSTGTIVNCTRRVNVRGTASGSGSLVGYAYLGDTYKVLDKTGSWYKVQYNANTTAYIWANYLSASLTSAGYVSSGAVGAATPAPGTTPTPTPVASKTLTIVNCQTCVNVRSGAGTANTKLGYAYLNEAYPYTSVTADGWYAITFNGGTGYVSGSFVKVN